MNIYQEREELLFNVQRLQLAPLYHVSWLRGVAPKRHLGDVTGLSQARLANSHQMLRPSTARQVLAHSEAVYRANLAESGLSAEDIDSTVDRLLKIRDVGGNGWAEFWFDVDYPTTPELTPCVASGLQLDQLLNAILRAIVDDTPGQACDAFEKFVSDWKVPTDVVASGKPGLAATDWHGADTWEQVTRLADAVLWVAFLDQFAHVDAMWGSTFFSRFQPRPVFGLIAPVPRSGGGVNKPVRRLLELSWAVNQWARYRTWPAERPGPKDLAGPLEVEPAHVSNLFDGTTKLRLSQFAHRWERFNLLQQKVHCPIPLAAVAICWQNHLVEVTSEHKLRSFIVLGDEYTKLWHWRRSIMAAPSSGKEPWATWL